MMPLFTVALHAVKITWRGGVPKVEQGVTVGPLVAPSLEEVQTYAESAVRKAYPATRDWSGHAWTATETPDSLVRQAASELERAQEPTLAGKQRRKTRERNEE